MTQTSCSSSRGNSSLAARRDRLRPRSRQRVPALPSAPRPMWAFANAAVAGRSGGAPAGMEAISAASLDVPDRSGHCRIRGLARSSNGFAAVMNRRPQARVIGKTGSSGAA